MNVQPAVPLQNTKHAMETKQLPSWNNHLHRRPSWQSLLWC